jgi:CMP-N-acetylneuraminic acid synthetase
MSARRRICTILARGGSKGVPGKNLLPLAGKPLLAHAIDQARDAALFDAIAVSSEADSILDTARRLGVEHVIRRPAEMATDEASKLPAIQHCVREVESRTGITYDAVVDLGVVAPLRTADDIQGAVASQERTGVSVVVSVTWARSTPYFNIVEQDENGFFRLCKPVHEAIQRRQDGPRCYELNGAIYVWRRDSLMMDPRVFYPDTLIYEMPHERSVDIDSVFDLELAEFLISRRHASGGKRKAVEGAP